MAVEPASDDEIFDQIQEMPEKFLACRDLAHTWKIVSTYRAVDSRREEGKRPRGGNYVYAERNLLCTRCGMKRSDAFRITSARGHTVLQRIQPHYDQPPGYALKGVGKRKGLPDIVRGEMFERELAKIPPPKRGRPKKESNNVTPIKKAESS